MQTHEIINNGFQSDNSLVKCYTKNINMKVGGKYVCSY